MMKEGKSMGLGAKSGELRLGENGNI